MRTKIAINGLGRIGRAVLKLASDEASMDVVAVSNLVDVEDLAYLLRFDTVYGRYSKPVAVDKGELVIAGQKLRTLNCRDPSDLPWEDLGVELVSNAPARSRGARTWKSTFAPRHGSYCCRRHPRVKGWRRSSTALLCPEARPPLSLVPVARPTASRRSSKSLAVASG